MSNPLLASITSPKLRTRKSSPSKLGLKASQEHQPCTRNSPKNVRSPPRNKNKLISHSPKVSPKIVNKQPRIKKDSPGKINICDVQVHVDCCDQTLKESSDNLSSKCNVTPEKNGQGKRVSPRRGQTAVSDQYTFNCKFLEFVKAYPTEAGSIVENISPQSKKQHETMGSKFSHVECGLTPKNKDALIHIKDCTVSLVEHTSPKKISPNKQSPSGSRLTRSIANGSHNLAVLVNQSDRDQSILQVSPIVSGGTGASKRGQLSESPAKPLEQSGVKVWNGSKKGHNSVSECSYEKKEDHNELTRKSLHNNCLSPASSSNSSPEKATTPTCSPNKTKRKGIDNLEEDTCIVPDRPVIRKRGRPKKHKTSHSEQNLSQTDVSDSDKDVHFLKRSSPAISRTSHDLSWASEDNEMCQPSRGRGRPRKSDIATAPEDTQGINSSPKGANIDSCLRMPTDICTLPNSTEESESETDNKIERRGRKRLRQSLPLLHKNSFQTEEEDDADEEDEEYLESQPRKRQRTNSSGASINAVSMKKEARFYRNQEVLSRWSDGLFYLAVVVKVNEKKGQCFVRFEDQSEFWVLFKDIVKGVHEGDETCCICQKEDSQPPNEIVLCDNCGLGYHQECHNPVVSMDLLDLEEDWFCRHCVFASSVKKGGALKIGPNASAFQKMKLSFPYQMNKLTWDTHHRSNEEQCYCYCGGPGDWYLKMLQCCRCRQWFHEACIQCLEHPILNGDRFYLFVCAPCNGGPEYLKRLDLQWVDVVHLSLYNLTVSGKSWQKYYELDVFIDFVNKIWDLLQINSKEITSVPRKERRAKVLATLNGHKTRFQSGAEIRKRLSLWGLRIRVPPPGPSVVLPVEGEITDAVMNNLKIKGRYKTCSFVPVQCKEMYSLSHSPIPFKSSAKFNSCNESIAFKICKAKLSIKFEASDSENNSSKLVSESRAPSPEPVTPSKITGSNLEAFIPPPEDFTGLNHPFKHACELESEAVVSNRKSQILNYLFYSCESDATSQLSVCSGSSNADDPTKAIPTPPPSISSSQSLSDIHSIQSLAATPPAGNHTKPPSSSLSTYGAADKQAGAKRRMDTEEDSESEEGRRRSKRARLSVLANKFSSVNTSDPKVIEHMRGDNGGCDPKMRGKLMAYNCAADGLKKGEDYEIWGKRVTPDGKVHYLMNWHGINK